MKIIVDTSSWLALVRYYIPFDPNSNIFLFFKNGIDGYFGSNCASHFGLTAPVISVQFAPH